MLQVVRDRLPVTAGIAAESEYARVWCPSRGIFLSDPALLELPPYKAIKVHSLQVWVILTAGTLKRGVVVELVNLTDQRGERFSLPSTPRDGVQGFFGVRYNGAPFTSGYGCGWWCRKGALADTNSVYMRIEFEGGCHGQ